MKRTYKDGNEFFKDATKEAKKYSKDIKALEYTCTSDMTLDEIAECEKEHNAVCLQFDNGGCLEIQYGEMYSVDEHGVRVIGNETPSLMFSMCDQVCEIEVSEICSSKEEILKLRNYLDKIIEKFK